ncbi:G5 domain-containing protein [Bifidobacterium simiarum]|uniref:G5 domain-containing protein n=1 Tax=Bifidobacterium simiarum TaxID=2045441 RepID=A0A2M9HF64_9BIFI|nr:phage tail tip lysozyme [Bifidobacterium simiarum]PJM75445.1 hypothetical protein CSQ87_05420 [Bifidobacterium simiarum]
MARHRKEKTFILKRFTRRQWMGVAGGLAVVAMLVGGGLAGQNLYHRGNANTGSTITAYSATKSDEVSAFQAASRGDVRTAIKEGRGGADANTSYVKVVINGDSRVVLGESFTDVKSVLEQGGITLESGDTVSPSLTTKVSESTVIKIERSGSTVQTTETEIPFNTVEEKTDSLPAGTKKVKTEGKKGVMARTNLVTKAGSKVISSNTISSWVKTAPTNKVVLVGTGTTSSESTGSSGSSSSGSTGSGSGSSSSSSASVGTTVPVGEMQQWAHDYLISSGYSEGDFTGLVYIINHESGWDPHSTNPSSGAYGLPQALPGSKMASAGADWQNNYQTQLKWFISYCNERYGGIQGAYSFWLSHSWY